MNNKPGQAFILMLEDDADDRFITESVFRENGYHIRLEFVQTGEELMEFLSGCMYSEFPSLILLDKNLPAKSGIEVLQEIRSQERYCGIPVVIISGSFYPPEVVKCYQLGANSFIQKPATNKLTRERIESFVNYWFGTVSLPDHQAIQAFDMKY